MRLQYIGRPKTWRDADTGNLVSDLDSIHRNDTLEGDVDDFGADDFDEFGDDDSDEDWSDDDDSDEDFGDDDSDDDDEIGATRGSRRRRARRQSRRGARKSRRSARKSRRRGSSQKVPMQKTVLAGSATSAAAGAVTITIIPSHKFKASDIVFNGSSSNATVNSITFGDNLIWNNAAGVDVSVLSTSSFIRGMIEGAKATPGVPIVINGTIAVANDTLKATLFGKKPGRVC